MMGGDFEEVQCMMALQTSCRLAKVEAVTGVVGSNSSCILNSMEESHTICATGGLLISTLGNILDSNKYR